jgi:hypothetical protein
MSDGERPVLCRVSHEAVRDLADRVHFGGSDEKVFEAYRELIEQVASDAYDAGTSVDEFGLVLVTSEALQWAAAREEKPNRERHVSQQFNPERLRGRRAIRAYRAKNRNQAIG